MSILCGLILIAASLYQLVAVLTGERTNQRLPRIYCVEAVYPNGYGRLVDIGIGALMFMLGVTMLLGLFHEGSGSFTPYRYGRGLLR